MTAAQPPRCCFPDCPTPCNDVRVVTTWRNEHLPICAGHRELIAGLVQNVYPALTAKAAALKKELAA